MAFSCPLLTSPFNKRILSSFGESGLAAVHAFLQTEEGKVWQNATFDESLGAIVHPAGHSVHVKDLMHSAELYGFAEAITEGGLIEALRSQGDAIGAEIAEALPEDVKIVLISGEEKSRWSGDTLVVSPEAHKSEAALVQTLITRGLQRVAEDATDEQGDKLKAVLATLEKEGLFVGDAKDFITRLFTDSTFRGRVRELNNRGVWKEVRRWINKYTGVKTGGEPLESALRDLAPKTKRYKERSKTRVQKDNVYNQAVRSIQNRLRELESVDPTSDRAKAARREAKRLTMLLAEAKDSATVQFLTDSHAATVDDLWTEHQERVEEGTVDHEWLHFMVSQSAGLNEVTHVLDTLLAKQNTSRMTAEGKAHFEERRQRNLKTMATIRAIAAEHQRLAPGLLVEEALPYDFEIERRYQEKYEKEFGHYAKGMTAALFKRNRSRTREFKTREEFDEARRNYVEEQMEQNREAIEQEKRDFLEKSFTNLDSDVSNITASIRAAQHSGVKIIAIVKGIFDRVNNVARKDTIHFREKLDPLYSAFYAARNAALGRDPKTARELYAPLLAHGLNGEPNGYLLAEINEGKFLESKRVMIEAMEAEKDLVKKKEILNDWYQENHEHEYTQEWYQFLKDILPEKTELHVRLAQEKKNFISQFLSEDGVTYDYSLASDEDIERIQQLEAQIRGARSKMDPEDAKAFFASVEFIETEHFKEVSADKKKTLSKEAYAKWLSSQKYTSGDGNMRLLPMWTEMVPKDKARYINTRYEGPGQPLYEKYHDARYDALMALPETDPMRQFYDALMREREIMDASRPEAQKLRHRLPSVRMSKRERFENEGFAATKESFKESFRMDLDDTDYGDRTAQENAEGLINKGIPLFYTNQVVDSPSSETQMATSDLSFDLMRSFVLDKHNSSLHRERMKERATIDNARRALSNAKVTQRTGKGGRVYGFGIGEEQTIEGKDSNAYDMLVNLIDKELHGIKKIDEKVLGASPEFWEAILRYNSFSLLALNMKNAASNATVGNLTLALEAAAGGYVSKKAFRRAHKRWWGDSMSILGDVAATKYNSRTNILSEYFDSMNDFGPDEFSYRYGSPDAGSVERARRWVQSGSAWHMASALPEHMVQNVGMYAVLEDIKIVNAEGKPIDSQGNVVSAGAGMSLLDAMETKDGKASVHEAATHMIYLGAKVPVDDANLFRVTQRIRGINEKMHGAYSEQNRGDAYRHVWGRVLFQMKGWLVPAWDKRWRGTTGAWASGWGAQERHIGYDEQLQTLHEGHYATTVHFLGSLMRDVYVKKISMSNLFSGIGETLDGMTEHELVNLKRSAGEVAMIFGAIALFSALKGLGDEEDDETLQQMLYFSAYVARRSSAEFGFYVNPKDMMSLMQDPAAIFAVPESAVKFANQALPWNITDQYETTWREGQYKIQKKFEDLVPFWRHYSDLFHIEDTFNYYNL